jgi:RNA polymerase sigma-B factor
MIMGEIRHYFRDNFNTIKIPRKYFDVSHAMNEFVKVYFQKSKGKMPTVKEIAKGINYDEELILETAEAMQLKSLVKLDVGSGSQKTSKPKEVSDNSIMYQEDDKNQIFSDKLENTIFMENILNSLSYREMKVLRMYFINKQTQRDIAERFKISQAHVFRVLNKALEHAKSKIKEVLKD